MTALLIAYGIIGLIMWTGMITEFCDKHVWRARDWYGLPASLFIVVALWPAGIYRFQVCTWRKEQARG